VIALTVSVLASGCGPGPPAEDAAAKTPETTRRRTPSGLPVPRYVSLKFDEVNARGGPGDDYRLLWTYRAEGLPLQVIAETADWRRVCDPEGAMAWVHQRTVESRRTVMRTQEQPLDLRRAATADAPVAARLAGRSTATLDQCKDGWCRVSVGRARGWIPQTEVWGTAESPQCRPPLPVVRR
jgi:SH3-like domain-containing protein